MGKEVKIVIAGVGVKTYGGGGHPEQPAANQSRAVTSGEIRARVALKKALGRKTEKPLVMIGKPNLVVEGVLNGEVDAPKVVRKPSLLRKVLDINTKVNRAMSKASVVVCEAAAPLLVVAGQPELAAGAAVLATIGTAANKEIDAREALNRAANHAANAIKTRQEIQGKKAQAETQRLANEQGQQQTNKELLELRRREVTAHETRAGINNNNGGTTT